MTPKELLYVEDVLGHTQAMKNIFADSASKLSDPALKNLCSELSGECSNTFNTFYSLLK